MIKIRDSHENPADLELGLSHTVVIYPTVVKCQVITRVKDKPFLGRWWVARYFLYLKFNSVF